MTIAAAPSSIGLDDTLNPAVALPFSRHLDRAVLIERAHRLAEALGLSVDVCIVEGNAQCGVDSERRFRLNWWRSGEDPLHEALHQAKTRVYREAKSTRRWTELTEAWRRIETLIRSGSWRRHLIDLKHGLKPEEAAYLRLAYRAAQQAWSRALRSHAIMPAAKATCFVPLVELFVAGAWPLGCHQGSLWVFVWNKEAAGPLPFGPSPFEYDSSNQNDYIFLSIEFRDSQTTALWDRAFSDRGWNTLHGKVSEEIGPPEIRLGKRIQEARAVVGLLDKPDPDFGVRWWMYQELDYAIACKRPVVLVSTAKAEFELARIPNLLVDALRPGDNHELWRWLQTHLSGMGGEA